VLIREGTEIGDSVLIGTNSIVENNCKIGNNVSIQSNAYIPTNTTIRDFVFIGPNVCLTNDKYPARIKADLVGPTIEKGATVGANATILPGIRIGEGSMVAAGAVVTKDVTPWKIAIGVPAKEKDMPDNLRILNKIK
jgi:acetyltransferase-like isoleucine patch superfamily enzyme